MVRGREGVRVRQTHSRRERRRERNRKTQREEHTERHTHTGNIERERRRGGEVGRQKRRDRDRPGGKFSAETCLPGLVLLPNSTDPETNTALPGSRLREMGSQIPQDAGKGPLFPIPGPLQPLTLTQIMALLITSFGLSTVLFKVLYIY